MCLLTKKLALFNYTIDRWAELQATKDNSNKETAIQKFSTTQLMKLLYFTCLESANNGKVNDEYTVKRPNLFDYFNNWVAYGNGGVEQTIYDHKEQMQTISKNEKFEYKSNTKEGELETLIKNESLSTYTEMIDKSIKALTNYNGQTIPFDANDIEKLIWLSHGELWNIAQFADGKKMFVNEPYFLNREFEEFDKRKENVFVERKIYNLAS